jgi:3',5'-cyclic-AMP phosphodiesterase
MKRRPFIQKLSVLGATAFIPLELIGRPSGKLKFIVASDGHYGQPETAYHKSHADLIKAVTLEKEVDFMVFNGDLIHDQPEFLQQVKHVYAQLPFPFYAVRGNHDRISNEGWQKLWGYPTNHSFRLKEHYGFLILDSSNEAGDYLCIDTNYAEIQLKEMAHLSAVFVFVHISQQDWTKHGRSCPVFLSLIGRSHNVKAVFHGHDHDVDGIMYSHKKPYLWSGHFGGNWGAPHPSYRVCEVGEKGQITTCLKTVSDGSILNIHSL